MAIMKNNFVKPLVELTQEITKMYPTPTSKHVVTFEAVLLLNYDLESFCVETKKNYDYDIYIMRLLQRVANLDNIFHSDKP